MKMKKKQLFDNLRYADDDILGEMAELCRPLDKAADRRILSGIERKCGGEVCGDDTEDYGFEVKGVDVYMRPKWYKKVKAAAICLLCLGGICIGTAGVRKLISRNANDITSVSGSDMNEDAEKTEINIALVGNEELFNGVKYVHGAISKMNSSSDKYRIKLTEYKGAPDDKEQNYDELTNRLAMDMAAGKVPDVIIAPSYQLDKFRRNGYLTDLSPLMDSGVGLKSEDLLDSVRKSIDDNGKIEIIYPAFKLYTAAVETERAGEGMENWNVQQAIDAYNSSDGKLLLWMSREYDLNSYFFYGAMMSCIDFSSHSCVFGNDFVQTMDFLKSVPDCWAIYGNDADQVADPEGLVRMMEINGINEKCAWTILTAFKDAPVTFVGYPTNNGRGSFTDIPISLGILSNTKNKEAVWEAVSEMFFNTEFLRRLSEYEVGIPVTKKAVDKLMKLSEYEEMSINKGIIVWDEDEEEKMKFSDEQKQMLYDYINRVEIDPFVNKNIEQIIKEESDYVFNGERGIDEFIEIINSRIGLYLSETQ